MLAYGAAKSSVCLLQNFKLLDILLPFQVSGIAACLSLFTAGIVGETLIVIFANFYLQAAYLADQSQKKIRQDSTMLLVRLYLILFSALFLSLR